MQHFDFDTPIDRTGTYCTQWDYVQDRFGTPGLLPFTISDMDFASPPAVLAALKQRLDHPVLGYSRWNHDDFKSSIIHWFHQRFDATMEPEMIVYGPSVIYMISKLIRLWSQPGDGVVFHSPAYDAFERMIEGLGRSCVPSRLRKGANGYEIDWADLEAQLSQPHSRVFLLCSPHNPTGRVWRRDELTRLAQLCEKHQVAVISDEIHMDVSFAAHTPFQGFGMTSPWALITSASKSFNIPALTGAYGFIADQQSRDRYLYTLKQVDGLSSPAILGVLATMAAYQHGAPWLDALSEYVHANHQYVSMVLNDAFPSVAYQVPQATYLAWIDLSSLDLDMNQLNQCLIKDFNVAIMQGSVYGQSGAGFVRLNLGCPRSKVEAGVTALIGAIRQQY